MNTAIARWGEEEKENDRSSNSNNKHKSAHTSRKALGLRSQNQPEIVADKPPIRVEENGDGNNDDDFDEEGASTIAWTELDVTAPPVHLSDAEARNLLLTPTIKVLEKRPKAPAWISPLPTQTQSTEQEEKSSDGDDHDDESPFQDVEEYNSQVRTDIEGSDKKDDQLPLYSTNEAKTQKRRRKSGCIFWCSACAIGTILILAIALLGYTLFAVRNEDVLSPFEKEFWKEASQKIQDTLFFWQDDENEVLEETDDALYVTSGTYYPTHTTTLHLDRLVTIEEITSIVLSASRNIDGINETAFYDPSSMQHSLMEWIASDPNLQDYSDARILQRYALGCFYKQLTLSSSSINSAVQNTWMSYEDECTTWKSTEKALNQNGVTKKQCDDQGRIKSIHLENVGLEGSLALELAFLSDSLQSIYLTKNRITGSIPSSYGQLTNLRRLQLSRNNIGGSLPIDLQRLEKLEILGLGQNDLTGTLPSQVGNMPSLVFLNLPGNKISGSLPQDWDNSTVKHLSLRQNRLQGTIPYELTAVESLTTLQLEGNQLEGTIPEDVCLDGSIRSSLNVTLDCQLVKCSCCHGCSKINPSNVTTTTIAAITPLPVSGAVAPQQQVVENPTTTTIAATIVPQQQVVSTAAPPVNTVATINPQQQVVSTNTIDPQQYAVATTTTAAPQQPIVSTPQVNATDSFPYVDDVTMANLMAAPKCKTIDVGFSCYEPGWSIDFELSTNDCADTTNDYDLVALYSSTQSEDALFWATSCGLADCDGVLSTGQLYYRNTYPTQTGRSNNWWPLSAPQTMRLRWINVDATGTVYAVAESKPFRISEKCP